MINAILRALIFIGIVFICLFIAVPPFRDFVQYVAQEVSDEPAR